MDDELLDQWDKKIHSDRLALKYSGCYYKFESSAGALSEGCDDLVGSAADIEANTPCILTSCSKVFTGAAVMRTMHLKPNDWYPEKPMHEFPGWEAWRDFPVYDNVDTSDGKPSWSGTTTPLLTIHHLLTHTSGWPFGLRGKRERILNMPLYFEPGTNFGYSIGHRILGWMLLDYWREQPEGQAFENLNDVFNFLVYEPLGLTGTFFIEDEFETPHSVMGEFFSMKYFDNPDDDGDDNPADLALASTGADMMKLAMMALRRGVLEDGSVYIARWNEWAGTNQLPGNKLSTALAHWRMEGHDDINFLWRTLVTRTVNAGPFGWSYFGATYHDVPADHDGDAGPPIAVGWKGFSSCGLRADYEQDVAFVVMQECVPDPGNRNFSECIHQGKVGDFRLGDVGRKLAQVDEEELALKREAYPKRCGGCHDMMTEVDRAGCFIGILQGILRVGYRCALPLGVRILKYHKSEQLGEPKYLTLSSSSDPNSSDYSQA
uniref:Beta-lactamase-related domain-containing protein n=1 Tax=Alexandrium monilatum TaxID=311494 RepID=A0A6T1FAS2_9DINO